VERHRRDDPREAVVGNRQPVLVGLDAMVRTGGAKAGVEGDGTGRRRDAEPDPQVRPRWHVATEAHALAKFGNDMRVEECVRGRERPAAIAGAAAERAVEGLGPAHRTRAAPGRGLSTILHISMPIMRCL
jgi:hypothetical protein